MTAWATPLGRRHGGIGHTVCSLSACLRSDVPAPWLSASCSAQLFGQLWCSRPGEPQASLVLRWTLCWLLTASACTVLTVGRALFQALRVQIDVCTGASRVYMQDQLPVAATTERQWLQTTQTDSLAVPEAGRPEARCQLSCFRRH